MTNRLEIDVNCWKCKRCHKTIEDQKEKLHADVETVKKLSYLDNRTDSEGGCEVAVTSRNILGWVNFRECQYLLF